MSHPPQGPGNGPPSAGIPIQHQQGTQGSQPGVQSVSSQNLNQIVIEYLVKKGYNRTEQMLRVESSNLDPEGRPKHDRVEDLGNGQYAKAFQLLNGWIDQNLDIYKTELKRLLWPIFIYSYLTIIKNHDPATAEKFFRDHSAQFEANHADELRVFETIKLEAHLADNQLAKLYQGTRYRIPLNSNVYFQLTTFLDTNHKQGGSVITMLLQSNCDIQETTRGPMDQFSFEAIISQARGQENDVELQEGIPGAFTGVSNKDIMNNNAVLKLGMMPMESELAGDVRAALEEDDIKNQPQPGQLSLVEVFDRNIKREDSADGPTRNEIPLPPSRARDVYTEVQKIKENRIRFKIEGRTGGVGVGVSVVMYTFHNTLDAITCIEFSDDNKLVAVGTEESYIRVWDLGGKPLPSIVPSDNKPTMSRRLIGHSAPVYSVSFSPSIDTDDIPGAPPTGPQLLLSCSSDGTIRLWSLETWTCLVVYKGHEGPVWNVRFGPFGHYFVSCGWDKTVRVWAQDHISYLRMMVGHDTNVNQIAWHPNGAYVFSASDQHDKSVRMWSFVTGECVRVFTGHSEWISALECSPNGKILASADGSGCIILWDLAKGTMIKRCRGHAKGGVYSLSFSVESTVLISGGHDNTVRVWDVELPANDGVTHGKATDRDDNVIAVGGQEGTTRINAQNVQAAGASGSGSGAAGGGGKKKGKETMITPDQISAFPTKKTPVYKVKFTRTNCVVAGGCYLP